MCPLVNNPGSDGVTDEGYPLKDELFSQMWGPPLGFQIQKVYCQNLVMVLNRQTGSRG